MMTTPIIMKYDDRCLENATHINIMEYGLQSPVFAII